MEQYLQIRYKIHVTTDSATCNIPKVHGINKEALLRNGSSHRIL